MSKYISHINDTKISITCKYFLAIEYRGNYRPILKTRADLKFCLMGDLETQKKIVPRDGRVEGLIIKVRRGEK